MSREFNIPGSDELFARLTSGGRTPEQLAGLDAVVREGMERGVVKKSISCWDNKTRALESIRRTFDLSSRDPLSDVELGMHIGGCKSPICRRIGEAYFERPSAKPGEDLMVVGQRYVDALALELVMGRELEDRRGKNSDCYDSATGNTLPVIKAVDIAHLCIQEEETDYKFEKELIYINPQKGPIVELNHALMTLLDLNSLNVQSEVFEMHARVMGIDPRILFEIIHANAPVIKR